MSVMFLFKNVKNTSIEVPICLAVGTKDLFVASNFIAPATGRARTVSVRNCWFRLQTRLVKTSGYRVSIGSADFPNLGVLRFRNYCVFSFR